jgi:hypothetical protein
LGDFKKELASTTSRRARAVTFVAHGHVSDGIYAEATSQFVETELSDLTLAILRRSTPGIGCRSPLISHPEPIRLKGPENDIHD